MSNRYANPDAVTVTTGMTPVVLTGIKNVTITQQGTKVTESADNEAFGTFAEWFQTMSTVQVEGTDISDLHALANGTIYDTLTFNIKGRGPGTVADIAVTVNSVVTGPMGTITVPHGGVANQTREFEAQSSDGATNPVAFA